MISLAVPCVRKANAPRTENGSIPLSVKSLLLIDKNGEDFPEAWISMVVTIRPVARLVG